MSFRTLDIKPEYRTFSQDIVKEFYIPVLSQAVLYQRAVGFFSSSVLIDISKGICELVKNGGKIELIVSPKLSEEDIQAIDRGYKNREKVIEESLLQEMKEPESFIEEERLSLLSHLIERGILDIKVAIMWDHATIGMYHEKVGILYDQDGNKIAFSGSMNESTTALSINYECIDVFCSWEEEKRVLNKEIGFKSLWGNKVNNLKVIEFPKVCLDKLKCYQKDQIRLDIDEIELDEQQEDDGMPCIPKNVSLYEYQLNAISKWHENGFKGIFDMATGTGKTYTALGALTKLSKVVNNNLFVIIICPYTHLVTQWLEDVEAFNVNPIVAFTGGPNKYWKRELELTIANMNLNQQRFGCLLTTNKTFSSKFVQDQISKSKSEILLIADEVHNLGATVLQKALNEKIKYRLGLSATLERHRDIEGTKVLNEYFGEKCIEYGLERAIEEGYLTRYYYYPIVTYLDEDELLIYRDLTKKIAKCYITDSKGNKKLNELGELLALKRARIVSAAKEKLVKLKELMQGCKDESHLLIYCGDSRLLENEEFTTKQIDRVCNMLIQELGITCARFTYTENSAERAMIKSEFEKGDYFKALVAIKCLDEGVNIPCIKKAFILSSSTNPKEYIQRRGRVLRKAKGKEYAYIYDFITLPRRLEVVEGLREEEKQEDITLIEKELVRIREFANLSENFYESYSIMKKIEEKYNIYEGERRKC